MNELTQMCMFASWQNTENPRAANPAHLHPEQKTKQISFNCAWEIIMENKTKSTQTFQCQGNLATCFALGKLHNDTQIGTTFPTEENQRPKGLWTTAVTVLNTKSNWGLSPIARCSLQYQSVFLTVDRICKRSLYLLWGQQWFTSDIPRISCSARLRRGQVSKQVKYTFQNGQFYIKLCSSFLTEYSFNIKFVSLIFVLAF